MDDPWGMGTVLVTRGQIALREGDLATARHAFVQNLRRGFYDLGTDVPSATRGADAFDELALVI